MTTIKLNTGAQIPLAGLGTWKSLPEEAAYDAVKHALSVGCRHIDCAWIYGNEKQVGRALNEAFANGLPREEVFVTTKLWNTKHRKEDVAGALEESLNNLGLEYVDLYLMHWPMAFAEGEDPFPKAADGGIQASSVPIQETWQALEDLVLPQGVPLKTRAIGVSNFSIPQLKALLDTHPRVIPAMNQIENHVYLQQPKLVQFCHENGIAVTAYSPLGSPSRPGLKQEDPVVLEDELLIQIAQKHARSPAQIALRFLVQRGLVVIPKSVTPERITANLQLFDFTLSDEEMAALTAKDKSWRAITFNTSISHPEYPFHPHKQDIASSSL